MIERSAALRAVSAFAAGVIAVGCGPGTPSSGTGPGGNTRTGPTGPTATNVNPLGVHEQDKHQALILGTTPDGGSTALPLASGEQRITVEAMWVRHTTPATGGSTPVTLTTAPQADQQVRVGVYEQFEGGVGDQFRSAIWIAAFLASTTLGRDLTDFRFSAEASGFLDGPSAGGLFTAGFLAALTGAELDPTATMTGTVNPDGTVGPVGGIPQKFLGSIEKGRKKLGYPIGLRYSIDVDTGKAVDLHAIAREHGVEAREIRDIYDAYELITGKPLPRPVPVDVREMELDAGVNKRFQDKYASWSKLMGRHLEELFELHREGKLPMGLRQLGQRAIDEMQAAERALNEGMFATAYTRIIDATVFAATTTSVYRIVDKVSAGDVQGGMALLVEEAETQNRPWDTMRKIGELHPDSIGGHLLMISAFMKANEGVGLGQWGLSVAQPTLEFFESLQGKTPEELASPQVIDELINRTTPTILNLTRGEAMAVAAREALEIEDTKSLNYSCSEPAARRLAISYASAATANVRYYETFVMDRTVEQFEVSEADAKLIIGILEPDYVVADWALKIGLYANLKDEWGEESLAWSLNKLSGSILSYFKASLLVAREYSLGVQKDSSGRAVSVVFEKAFINMIENAERSSREHAHAAKVAVGQVPIQARIAYQNARVLREGDLNDKLRALEYFWASTVYSQTAVVLARAVINLEKHPIP